LLVPAAIAGFVGIVATNTLHQSSRAVSWAVNQAVLGNGLRPTPTMTSTGAQRQFEVTFIPDANGGTYNWTLSNAIPEGSRNCMGGQNDIACGAWITMTTMGQFIISSLGSSSLTRVHLLVRYDDSPVDVGVEPRLGKYRKVTVAATGYFDGAVQSRMRNVSGIGSLLPSFSVTRTETIG
jgi:hypothetical protein